MIEVAIQDNTPELMQRVEAAAGRFVYKGAFYIEGQLRASMNEQKSGRRYPRGKDSFHIASAPGESPAVDSSNFFGSIQVIIGNVLEAKIGTPVEYALYLEDGTERMAPRPLWEKTATDAVPVLETMLEAELGRAH
jgi:hypothetical protein